VDPLSVLTVHPTLVSMPLIWILLPITLAPDDLATAPAVRVGGAAHDHLVVERDTPVVVAVSKVGERRWGYHQFPKLSPLPGGKQLLTFNASPDDNAAYGHPGPAFVSGDSGRTWQAYDGDESSIAVSHSPISQVADGEFLCVPFPQGINLSDIPGMPKSVGSYFCYAPRKYFVLDDCPQAVRDYYADIRGFRWSSGRWKSERIQFPKSDVLIWTSEQKNGSILSRTSFEYPLLRANRELYLAEYKYRFKHADGSIPKGMVVTCMASRDRGRTFERRGVIAFDPDGKQHPSETAMAATSDGKLVALGRATDHRQQPMWITFSADRGHTWTARQNVFDFGVMPQLLRLDNGVLVTTFGRPGVQMGFSVDGTGQTWTQPVELTSSSCGYTSLLRQSPTEFLIAYSSFQHRDSQGQNRKAILVQSISVRRRRMQ